MTRRKLEIDPKQSAEPPEDRGKECVNNPPGALVTSNRDRDPREGNAVTPREKFQTLLRELFQFDLADLDFGINLNREDGGRRKFILVEVADYFDTVLLPRIKKVTFSPEWKDGKPKRPATRKEFERGPSIVKVIRLESYEDYERDAAFVAEHKLTDGADDIFVNGDSCIPGAQSLDGLFKARLFRGMEV